MNTASYISDLIGESKHKGVRHGIIKEGEVMRQLNSNAKSIFYPYTVFRQPHPLPEVALTLAGPLTTALYTTEREG